MAVVVQATSAAAPDKNEAPRVHKCLVQGSMEACGEKIAFTLSIVEARSSLRDPDVTCLLLSFQMLLDMLARKGLLFLT